MTDWSTPLKGLVLTAVGPVSPADLGVTLPHEHLLLDFSSALKSCSEYGNENLSNLDFSIQNLDKIRRYPYCVRSNLLLDSAEDILEELRLFKQAGGLTLCDATVDGHGLRIGTSSIPYLARESGVHIVCGTGYYVDDEKFPAEARSLSVDELAEIMVREIQEGIPGTGVRCGVIGEIGCSWPLTDLEKRVLKAAALAQMKTGAPLSIHPGRDTAAPFEILDILEQAGGDISHTSMCHLDRTYFDIPSLLEFAKRGSYLSFDQFGNECSHYQYGSEIDMPSDAQRIHSIKALVDGGFSHRILLSQDIHTKHRLVKYGGHGYAHVLNYVVHKMVDRGISKDAVTDMTTTNPQKWLTFT